MFSSVFIGFRVFSNFESKGDVNFSTGCEVGGGENFSPPLQDALKIFRPPFDLKFGNIPKPIKTLENIEFW